MTKKTIVTSLVGALFQRKDDSYDWPPTFQANAAGEYLATIDAVWLDSDGNVLVLAHDPHGNVGEFWPAHHRFVRGRKADA